MKSKRNEVATINIVQAQVKEMHFIFILEFRHVALSRGILHRLPTKSNIQQKPRNSSEMSETQCSHTLHISLNQGKLDGPVSQIGWPGLTRLFQQLVFKFRMFCFSKPDILIFTS
jgi:hypothetical protein